jgi:hypothetical protein
MLAFVPNPLASLLFLRVFMSQARCLEIHVNAVMGDADLKHFSYRDLQHPSPKSIELIAFANDLCIALVKGLPGPAHVLADCRLLPAIYIVFPDLLYPSLRYLHIQSNLFCSHILLLLANNPMDLELV